MVSDKIRQMILEKFGSPLKYPQQCEALALAIKEVTGETLGTTTLKRMLGFVRGVATPRRSSLDIVARYLGYPDYDMLSMDVGMDCGISDFRPVESIDSADLEIGERIRISYDPGRMLELSFLGYNQYVVDESAGSKLRKGDRLLIAGFYRGFELLVSDVFRDGRHLGSYQGAKQGGLTDIEIID
ncbi:MAG: hypothetical protein K2H86_09170 [Muribaculaceae bacterium]|nr:hypothetical protein [Muribaculaceae bacterium]